ncbi:UNVERIFIED_CONTAM: hypothetical protein HDU68_000993 [Siphonaria sp. JEL0065]|nr:hypothetical protein HDU68_000993 [Siphonaria sp. JEL0065]
MACVVLFADLIMPAVFISTASTARHVLNALKGLGYSPFAILLTKVVLTDEDGTNISSEKKPKQKDVVADAQGATKLVDEEEQRATGSVSLKVYKTYWDACGELFFLFSFIFFQ